MRPASVKIFSPLPAYAILKRYLATPFAADMVKSSGTDGSGSKAALESKKRAAFFAHCATEQAISHQANESLKPK